MKGVADGSAVGGMSRTQRWCSGSIDRTERDKEERGKKVEYSHGLEREGICKARRGRLGP
jgi:hypothetical protein